MSGEEKQIENEWLRWIAMPFAAYIGGALGTMGIMLLQWVGMKVHGGFSEDGWLFLYILPVFSGGVFGWLYVLITHHVSPRAKVVSGVVMTTILGVLTLIAIWINWFVLSVEVSDAIKSTIQYLVMMAAAVITLKSFHDEGIR